MYVLIYFVKNLQEKTWLKKQLNKDNSVKVTDKK